MTKLQVAIYMDSERLAMLEDVMVATHQKNISQALETIFKQRDLLMEQVRDLRAQLKNHQPSLKETPKDHSGIPPLDEKYKLKKGK
jgi:hypothetical protein